ncbi:Intraflagellar transport protein 140 [Amphibalanus amphitrite]|uniref:Intraflagellar transport protein 140 n=1 Tax=Amphibalanus amphitrite TaxID=1232801 RepID=A0A6A4V999_AMPAM|nr:Intraflagellar transport protein 140 [Amphibalanus amphitrite]
MNVEGVSPPTPFLARPGKPALPWSDWIFSFHNYLTALGGEAYSTERKTALLLHCVGAEAQRVYRTLPVQPRREDEDEFHAAERQLAEFYEPQVNVIAERFFFRQRRQESHEPTADYVAALRRLAVNCSFGQMTDAMIRDQVVEATVHPILRERFLQDKGLTLDRVLEIAEAFERSRREATAMAGPARPAADGAQMPVPAEEADLHEDSSAEEKVIALLTDEESVLTEQDVRTASAADPELQQLRHQIKRGWPSSAKACPVEVQPYFKIRHELWVRNDDVILRGAQQSGTLVGWKGDGQCNVTVVFQHDLKDPLTQLVFRAVEEHRQQPSVDLGGLARAAVSGDEVALDMFSSWRPKTSSTRFLVARQENLNVFVGSASG